MNASELAKRMLEWEKIKQQLDALTKVIEGAVLGIGQTQTVGNVRASFSGGRKSYDYMLALINAGIKPEQLKPFTTTPTPVVDHRAACKELQVTEIPFLQSEPSVSVKLLPVKTHEPDPQQHIRKKAENLIERKPETKDDPMPF